MISKKKITNCLVSGGRHQVTPATILVTPLKKKSKTQEDHHVDVFDKEQTHDKTM
jgi:hypothetical protein